MPVVIYTSNNAASRNIAEEYTKVCRKELEPVDTRAPSVLDVPDLAADYIVVLSSHKSKTAGPMITAHFPGNWDTAELGGEPQKLNVAYGSKIKEFMRAASAAAGKWPIAMEADHHGPTLDKAIIFVEIGSTEAEWGSKEAAAIVAKATVAMLGSSRQYETVFGVGGGHYAKAFTRLVLETDYAVGHVLPKYSIEKINYEMFQQAISKNVEHVRKVALLKEETNLAQK
ncbi:D-aminoacyl-tRNA deacylase [uncultured archaeon]|nr:D-aminoacyl-tRNA deacylase [uncultured archaeon]